LSRIGELPLLERRFFAKYAEHLAPEGPGDLIVVLTGAM
jgi:hypothetical protein